MRSPITLPLRRAVAGLSVLALSAGFLTAVDFGSPAAAATGCTIVGTEGDDFLLGTESDDVICAGGGNDIIRGLGGADRIDAGGGDDVIEGGDGDDTVAAGYGDDIVSGAAGRDTIDGGPGDDTLLGGGDTDTIAAGTGDDAVSGGAATDIIDGGTGTDICDGGTGWNLMANCDTATQSNGPDVDGPADLDGDLLPDDAEVRFGSNPARTDTDGDGLSDLDELLDLTDPRTADADADLDGDGLDAAAEVAHGTNPLRADTDDDSIDDHTELVDGTDPLKPDTDGDGVADADEAAFGTDPVVADSDGDGVSDGDEIFTRDLTLADVGATFTAEGTAAALLAVSLHASGDDRLQDVPGQRSPPVEVVVPRALTSGTLRIPFDTTGLAADAEVAVVHFDDDSDTFDIPTNQTIDLAAGIATVTTSDFSPFVVVDLAQLRSIWASEIKTPREGDANARSVDVVLTIDSSGSMTPNDPSGLRRTAAKSFVDDIPYTIWVP